MKDPMFDKALSKAQLSAWQSLKSVVTNFLGNYQRAEYKKEIEELLKSFHQLRARMLVELHFLRSLFSEELWRFEWRAGWAFSPRHSHYRRVLPRLLGCKLSYWLLLVLETGCSGWWVQEEVPEKTFHSFLCIFQFTMEQIGPLA